MTINTRHIAAGLALLTGAAAHAQPAGPLQTLERPMTDFMWLSGHNSFEANTASGIIDGIPCSKFGPESLTTQLDLFGMTFLELDLALFTNSDISGNINEIAPYVAHLCVDTCGSDYLTTKFAEIAVSRAIEERFIIVQLDASTLGPGGDPGCPIGNPFDFDFLQN
jgi:hypothetical protein